MSRLLRKTIRSAAGVVVLLLLVTLLSYSLMYLAPGDPAEAELVTREAIRTPGTCYLRLGRGSEPHVHQAVPAGWKAPESLTLRNM